MCERVALKLNRCGTKSRGDGTFSFIVSSTLCRNAITDSTTRPTACFNGSGRTVRFEKTPIASSSGRGRRHRRRKQPTHPLPRVSGFRCDAPSHSVGEKEGRRPEAVIEGFWHPLHGDKRRVGKCKVNWQKRAR